MSVPPSAQPAYPSLRRLAYAAVSLGCLGTAGTVLSAALKAPAPPPPPPAERAYLTRLRPVYATAVSPPIPVEAGPPMQAFVCLQGHTLKVTNMSPYPWHNVRARFGASPTASKQVVSFGPIAPHHTKRLYFRTGFAVMLAADGSRCPLDLSWECRTGHDRAEQCRWPFF